MMERELDRRRGWPWKNRKNISLSGSIDGSPSAPVKLFDEQEVARILQDQVRIGDEQMVEALNAADAKHAEKEKAWSEKLAAVSEKLTAAISEITIKDNLVKQHIKVAEEAVVGWEKAESEAAEFKAELENATKLRLETEDRARHLDGALKELMEQLRGGREAHDKRLHDTIVKKTREFDKLRLEMEAKMTELSKSLSDCRTQLIESHAENEALNHALKDRSRMIAELNDIRAHAETDSKILRVRLEGLEKENFDLKYKIHSITKELETRRAELEYGKKTSDVLSRHHADNVKKIVKLEDECNRLRMMVRKKLPNTAAIVRMKQELDALGKESGSDSGRPRRRPLHRSHSSGVPLDFLPVHELQEDLQSPRDTSQAVVERIANMDEETRMLKEALAKRNDELQAARVMCAKTASRLTAVEDELEMLRAASPELAHRNDASSSACSTSSMPISESSKRALSKNGSQKFSLMNDFSETERLVHVPSRSESTVNGPDIPEFQQQIAGLEDALAAKSRELEEANQMCKELSVKLTAAENQYSALQSRNAANEQSVITLQDRLDNLLESHENIPEAEEHIPEAAAAPEFQLELAAAVKSVLQATESLAQALQLGSAPEAGADGTTGSSTKSTHWQDPKLESSMSNLASIVSEGEIYSVSFLSGLSSTLACITEICNVVTQNPQKDGELKAEVAQLEEALHRLQEERAVVESRMQVELNRVSDLEREIEQLQAEKAEIVQQLSDVEVQIREANESVDTLKEQLKEAEIVIAELRLQQDHQKHEDDLIEEELLELSSSHPQLLKTMRAADAEMNELHAKLAALEVELQGERRRHHDVVAKLEDLQEQIHRGVGRKTDSGSVHSKEFPPPFMGEDEISKSARQEREISAAALAECQRTILALGKQLKILGFSESRELNLKGADTPDSIRRMTETMELLRWQTEASDQNPPPRKSSVVTESDFTDGPISVPASPARSDLEAPSTPESPATARRTVSVRTVRPFQLPKPPLSNGEVTISAPNHNATESLQEKSASTYTRFHARSPSETSVSSGHSNGNSMV
ncbi:hypothetical protein M758_1G069500 [Ceratodon purpureus]|nr:hypothetical protein M758_1G069500 [Ceratodon purpureus]KAG0629004.1 hypothetical protein M758_1G069500 [Ceratodon purpureus]